MLRNSARLRLPSSGRRIRSMLHWLPRRRRENASKVIHKDTDRVTQYLIGVLEYGPRNFEKMYEQLRVWSMKTGHARPSKYSMDMIEKRLGSWVHNRRQDYKAGGMKAENVVLLESLPGWSWEPFIDQFSKTFQELLDWVRVHGHACPSPHVRDALEQRLGIWVQRRRRE